MTDIERGYLAAIIDGEGTITLTKDKEFRYPVIAVSSTTIEIMNYLKSHFGGVISKKNNSNPKMKQAYCWKIERRKAITLLEEICPLLLEPKKQARAQLILDGYIKLTPRNGKYSEELRNLKHEFEEKFFMIE